ncbi:hypothetical protein RND71_001977 [Anisodus tanguticus]|uniref:Malectin-like domain-containing protein n=1 Tax=Anisodus tanguticus TaxID=243964 RepID=A0AAE1T146_9SOLA|nr:hypothetical protein RND71_001977 [Anisodus tanguticus]
MTNCIDVSPETGFGALIRTPSTIFIDFILKILEKDMKIGLLRHRFSYSKDTLEIIVSSTIKNGLIKYWAPHAQTVIADAILLKTRIFFTNVSTKNITISHFVNSYKDDTNSYSFVLACGATNNATDADGGIWSPDSTYLPSSSSGNSITSKAKYQDPSLISYIPYMTARIFKTQTAYTFPISPKSRHWIILHFYPSSYDNLNCSNSFFSVTVGEFTLLNNFSASITAQALTQAYIIREFTIVPLQTATLNITFNPFSVYKDAFAFINGIDVVSMPEIFQAAPMVGFTD